MHKMHSSGGRMQAIVQSVFALLGILFAVYYGSIFANDTEETVYLCFAILSALEAVCSLCSLVLHLRTKKGSWVTAVNIFSWGLSIPIVLFAMVWLLHWIGFDLLPPPQQ